MLKAIQNDPAGTEIESLPDIQAANKKPLNG